MDLKAAFSHSVMVLRMAVFAWTGARRCNNNNNTAACCRVSAPEK